LIYDMYILIGEEMRTLVDIPDRQLEDLNAICAVRKLSRAEVVRQAIDAFIEENRPSREPAFGIWKGETIVLPGDSDPLPEDGLAYQERFRSEW
jgi:Ribbon-helix-helix protein, copG family